MNEERNFIVQLFIVSTESAMEVERKFSTKFGRNETINSRHHEKFIPETENSDKVRDFGL